MSKPIEIVERSLDEEDIRSMSETMLPHHIKSCQLEGKDLSRLNFSGWTFEASSLVRTKFDSAQLEGSRFIRCRAGHASLEAANLSEAVLSTAISTMPILGEPS